MAAFTLLDQADEDKLHSARLLSVEEKPYKRITKRLCSSTSPIQSFYTRLPTPPADSPAASAALEEKSEDAAASKDENEAFQKGISRFRADCILDFEAFDASIARIQFLRSANAKERARYAAERSKIEATAQGVRENTSQLRVRLDEAQKTLAVRKTYDVLAETITKEKELKTRDEQRVNIEKLRGEIEDLEREGRESSQAWAERRVFFERVVREATLLKRLVRDEKEETHETQEEDDNMLGVGADRERDGEPMSQMGTPRPVLDEALTPAAMPLDSGVLTPRSTVQTAETMGASPRRDLVKDTADVEMGDGVEQDATAESEMVAEKPADTMDTS